MSKYEDYNKASRNYDNQRYAMGSDVMASMIQFHCGKPLKELHVLDAGCGTGNYAKALTEHGVGHVTLLDASTGMLEKAKAKLADAIEAGQVLHHLDGEADTGFRRALDTLKETRRILRQGGLLVISTCLPSTFFHSIWFTQLNLKITERYVKTLPSFQQFDEMFNTTKFECVQKLNTIGTCFLDEYYNVEGPLDKSWRQALLYWKFATDEELCEVEKKVQELKQSGELENWVRSHDHAETSGLLTWIFCKPQQK